MYTLMFNSAIFYALQPNVLHLVTPLINFLASHPQVPASMLSELRGVVIGAAPLGKELIHKFLSKFGEHIFLQEGIYTVRNLWWKT